MICHNIGHPNVLVLLYVLVDYKYWTISIKIHRTGYFYYYTTLPIVSTGKKISLHLQIYIMLDLKNMSGNIHKTSTYNRNLRVQILISWLITWCRLTKRKGQFSFDHYHKLIVNSNLFVFVNPKLGGLEVQKSAATFSYD